MANQGKYKKLIIGSSLVVSLLLLIGAISLAGHLKSSGDVAPASAALNMDEGSLTVTVCDGVSGEPLSGARVVVAETGEEYTTDQNGQTPAITVPIYKNERFDEILAQDWGEATLLVYHDG